MRNNSTTKSNGIAAALAALGLNYMFNPLMNQHLASWQIALIGAAWYNIDHENPSKSESITANLVLYSTIVANIICAGTSLALGSNAYAGVMIGFGHTGIFISNLTISFISFTASYFMMNDLMSGIEEKKKGRHQYDIGMQSLFAHPIVSALTFSACMFGFSLISPYDTIMNIAPTAASLLVAITATMAVDNITLQGVS